jgi:hypothetical protein
MQLKRIELVPRTPSDEDDTPEQLRFPFATVRSDPISYADACSVVERRRIGNGWLHLVEVLASIGNSDDPSPERPFSAVTVPRNSNARIEETG